MPNKRKASTVFEDDDQPPAKVCKQIMLPTSYCCFSQDILTVILSFVQCKSEIALVCKQFWLAAKTLQSEKTTGDVMLNSFEHVGPESLALIEFADGLSIKYEHAKFWQQLQSCTFPKLKYITMDTYPFNKVPLCQALIGIIQNAPALKEFGIAFSSNIGPNENCNALIQCLVEKHVNICFHYIEDATMPTELIARTVPMELVAQVKNCKCSVENRQLMDQLPFMKTLTILDLDLRCGFEYFVNTVHVNWGHLEQLTALTLQHVNFKTNEEQELFFASMPPNIERLEVVTYSDVFPQVQHLKRLKHLIVCRRDVRDDPPNYIVPDWVHASQLELFRFTTRTIASEQVKYCSQVPSLAKQVEINDAIVDAQQLFTAQRRVIYVNTFTSKKGPCTELMPNLNYLDVFCDEALFDQFELTPNLRTLRWSGNTNIDWSKLALCRKLHTVSIRCKALIEIPPVLATLPSLEKLELIDCGVTSVTSGMFDGTCSFPALQQFIIKDCPILSVPKFVTLACLKQLKILPTKSVNICKHTDIDARLLQLIHARFDFAPDCNVLFCVNHANRQQIFVTCATRYVMVPMKLLQDRIFLQLSWKHNTSHENEKN